MKIEIRALRSDGDRFVQKVYGTIRLVGNKLVSTATEEQHEYLMQDLLTEKIRGKDDKLYDPKKDPKGWIQNLCYEYRGPYLWATVPLDEE